MSKEIKPQNVSRLDVAFGRVDGLLPPMNEIPEEFRRGNSKWCDWQSDWFYSGLKRYPVPKDGVDVGKAMAHLAAIQGSSHPKHEHKVAGVAYLASLWFKHPDGEMLGAKPKSNK